MVSMVTQNVCPLLLACEPAAQDVDDDDADAHLDATFSLRLVFLL